MAARVPVHDGFMRAAELRARQTVDQHVRGHEAQPPERAGHRKNRRPPDIEPVDLPNAGRAHGDGEGALPNLGRELVALQRAEHLRVVQPANGLGTHRKDDGRGDHWTSQGTAADFIDSGDAKPAVAPQRRLAFQRRAAVPHVCGGSCSAVPAAGTLIPRFSRIRAALPASRLKK